MNLQDTINELAARQMSPQDAAIKNLQEYGANVKLGIALELDKNRQVNVIFATDDDKEYLYSCYVNVLVVRKRKPVTEKDQQRLQSILDNITKEPLLIRKRYRKIIW